MHMFGGVGLGVGGRGEDAVFWVRFGLLSAEEKQKGSFRRRSRKMTPAD